MAMTPNRADEESRLPVSRTRAGLTLLLHALAIWGLCGATMGVGMSITSLANALLIHAVAAPVIAAMVSFVYFSRFGYTTPLVTASCVLAFVVLVDFFLVALVVNRSLDMFRSVTGTWLPFALIFSSTFVSGVLVRRCRRLRASGS
jgi:hypothetical protein